ncbi:hypothetical protein OHR68_39470 [Spirillospora sp. NBC_00431]
MNEHEIPSLTVEPADAEPSAVRNFIEVQVIGRRRLLQSLAGAAMVLGVSTLDLLPGRNPAHAALKGSSPWQYWSRCTDYNTFPADWKKCNPDAAKVGAGYCQSRHKNRHRTDYVENSACSWKNYNKAFRCTGDSGRTINAWRWYKWEGPNTGPRSVSCSDGKVYYRSGNSNCRTKSFKSTCRHYL